MSQSISEELLHTTVRLVGNTKNGSSVGTGFFFHKDNRLFVVTNKHVVKDVLSGEFYVLKADVAQGVKSPKLGEYISISFNESMFIGHPNPDVDVSVMNVSGLIDDAENKFGPIFWKHLNIDLLPTDEHYEKFIGPMEEIVFIGYPSGLWDTKNILPIARKGMTATSCYIDFEGEPKFLVDASVFPGSSGSPVFIYYLGGHSDKSGNLYAGNRIHFIGIIAKVYQRVEQGEVKVIDVPTDKKHVAEVHQMIDLGVVFKSNTILDAIDNYVAIVLENENKTKTPRNADCPCGSKKRFKNCCGKLS